MTNELPDDKFTFRTYPEDLERLQVWLSKRDYNSVRHTVNEDASVWTFILYHDIYSDHSEHSKVGVVVIPSDTLNKVTQDQLDTIWRLL